MAAAGGDGRATFAGGDAAYEVEEVLFEEPNLSLVSAFLGADGPATLLVYEQPGVEGEGDEPPARQLYLATAESDRFVERGLLVVKLRDEALGTSSASASPTRSRRCCTRRCRSST